MHITASKLLFVVTEEKKQANKQENNLLTRWFSF